jgi:hypothetical protein
MIAPILEGFPLTKIHFIPSIRKLALLARSNIGRPGIFGPVIQDQQSDLLFWLQKTHQLGKILNSFDGLPILQTICH